MIRFTIIAIFLFLIVSLIIPGHFVLSSTGTIDATYKYAWGGNIGWINFGATGSNVQITDSEITGYAWSENYGWINLSPTNSGVINDGSGNLSGRAWGEKTGWINFSGVTIDSNGVFQGTATFEDGPLGVINFDCTSSGCPVKTSWRETSATTQTIPNVGGTMTYGKPKGPFEVLINNGDLYTNNLVVNIYLDGGKDAFEMMVSNKADFFGAVKESYKNKKEWILEDLDGQKFIYVKFFTDRNVSSDIVSDSVILDRVGPEIQITSIKKEYDLNENITIEGLTENNAFVHLVIDNNYGSFEAENNGSWFITLGKLSEGIHSLSLTPKDLAGNIGKTLTADFSIIKSKEAEFALPSFLKPLAPFVTKIIEDGLKPLMPFFSFQKPSTVAKIPKPVVTVPKMAQMPLGGLWNIFPVEPVNRFVLSPLPKDMVFLTEKFPKLAGIFKKVGVAKITDVEKIKNSKLTLPGLSETIGLSKIEVSPGKFSSAKGVPLSNLSALSKQKIPSEIIFAKTAGGLVDFNIALSLNDKGNAEQRIKTVAGRPLELIVKTDSFAKKVTGYVVFKSKKINDLSFQLPLKVMTASLMFGEPNFLKDSSKDNKESSSPTEVKEKILIVDSFEYKNTGSGVYSAKIQTPVVDGEYEILTVIDYENPDGSYTSKEISLITVVDPEGYVYEKDGDKETRISGAIISLYWLNPEIKQYELWDAKEYQQENPQTTDVRGTYSFLVPDGYYYLKVDSPGYLSYDGKPFEVKEGGGVHINIELKTKYWWTRIIDWKTLLLIIVVLMLLYNFYRDRVRDKQNVVSN